MGLLPPPLPGQRDPSPWPYLAIVLALVVGSPAVIWAVLHQRPDPAPQETAADFGPPSRNDVIRSELAYLAEVEEIAWMHVDDNDVYLGFSSRPQDMDWIVRGAAIRANRAIHFGVHVYAMPASERPGFGCRYYFEHTARHGRIEH